MPANSAVLPNGARYCWISGTSRQLDRPLTWKVDSCAFKMSLTLHEDNYMRRGQLGRQPRFRPFVCDRRICQWPQSFAFWPPFCHPSSFMPCWRPASLLNGRKHASFNTTNWTSTSSSNGGVLGDSMVKGRLSTWLNTCAEGVKTASLQVSELLNHKYRKSSRYRYRYRLQRPKSFWRTWNVFNGFAQLNYFDNAID